jgi:protein required for attachment to host cells
MILPSPDRRRRESPHFGRAGQQLRSKAYDRLVIVAAPSALGDLRPAISEQVRAKVTGEVAKDLTKTPDGEVAGHLKDVLSA